MAEVARDVATIAGTRAPSVRPWPSWLRAGLKPIVPILRELDETAHQFEHPFIVDASAAEQRFGMMATPWTEALSKTVRTMTARPLRRQA